MALGSTGHGKLFNFESIAPVPIETSLPSFAEAAPAELEFTPLQQLAATLTGGLPNL
jgi:hypothetical protein